jgi:hypothetical protein
MALMAFLRAGSPSSKCFSSWPQQMNVHYSITFRESADYQCPEEVLNEFETRKASVEEFPDVKDRARLV